MAVRRQHISNDHLNCYFMLSKVCEFLLLIGVERNAAKGHRNWHYFNENLSVGAEETSDSAAVSVKASRSPPFAPYNNSEPAAML